MVHAQMVVQGSRGWHGVGHFMGLHWLWWLFWVLAFLGVIWAFRKAFSDRRVTHPDTQSAEAAEQALRARFANGEIGEEEYIRKLQVLRETRMAP